MTKYLKTKFDVGDEVRIISSGKIGTIKSLTSYVGGSGSVYLVNVMGCEKLCVESNLSMCRKKNVFGDVDLRNIGLNIKIEDKINEIITLLDLDIEQTEETQILNAAKLQKYLTLNYSYEENQKNIGSNFYKTELCHALYNYENDFLQNAYLFSEILKKIGMTVLNVASRLQDGSFYVSNLVLIGEEYYYFDLTLEKEIYMDNSVSEEEFVLCCGALGRNSYEQFFKPLCLLDFNSSLSPNELPDNISINDIDIDFVNKLLMMKK